VRFTYTTPGLHTGLAITTVSLLILLVLGINLAFSRRRGESVENSD
jgi:ABC-type arginine/histidine transport system permease subunit